MTVPERNLPPDALPWGRSVDKRIEELTKRIGVAAATAKAAAARSASAARNTAYVAERADQLEQSQTAIVDEVVNKNESEWVPLEPANPQHGHHWYDITDGNVLKIYADYGDYERTNYVLNPTFRMGTDGWTALSGELATTAEGKGRISAPVDGAAAIVETAGRAVVIDIPADEDGGEGEAGQVGALWTASAEVELVQSSVTVTATLEVIGPDDEPVSSSGPVVIEYGTPVRITARPLPGVEGTMDEVRVALSLVNATEPEFEVTVDEVILEAAEYGDDEEQQFFDGSMPGVLWQGTPHYSTSWWDGQPRWIEAQDEKLKNEVFATTDEIRQDLDQAVADLAATQEWVDETGQELVQRVGSAEGAIGVVEDVLEGVRSNVGRKMWSGDSFTSAAGTFTVEPIGSGRLRIAHVEGTSPVPVRYLCGSNGWNESLDGSVVVVEVPEPGTYSVVAFDAPDATVGSDVLANLVVTAEMMSPDYGWTDMEWPDIDWTDAEIGLGQLRDAGLLDPDVWSRLFEDVVVGGVVAATEAFIGSNAIIDNAVQARHVVASESLWAKLATFARVTTDMLLVGGMNLLPDPRFEDAELTAGRMSRSAATEVTGGYQATGYFYWMPSTAAADVRRYAVPVTAGDTYRIEIPVTLTSALSSTPRLETWNTSATGRALRSVTDWSYEDGILSYTYKVPEGVGYLSPIIYRATSYTVHPGARVTLMADSRLLVDGAVTARAMNVVHELPSGELLRIDPDGIRVWRGDNNGPNPNIALTAGNGFRIQNDNGDGLLWIDPATGDLHTDGTVLSNSELMAPTITGGVFTGTRFRTSISGARLEMGTVPGQSSPGLYGFNPNGTTFLHLTNTGGLEMFARENYLPSDSEWFPRGTMTFHHASGAIAGIGWTSLPSDPNFFIGRPHTTEEESLPFATGVHIGEGAVSLRGGGQHGAGLSVSGDYPGQTAAVLIYGGAGANPNLHVYEDSTDVYGQMQMYGTAKFYGLIDAQGGIRNGSTGGDRVVVNDHLQVDYTLFTNNIAPVSGSSIQMGSANLYSVTRVGSGAASHFQFFSDYISSSGIRDHSNANAANVFISSSGRLYFATSSRNAKEDIEPVPEDYPERILQIEPKTFYDKANNERYARYLDKIASGEDPSPEELEQIEPIRRIPGLIAEDVEAAGLVEYVTYNDDGTVAGYNERLWTLLIPLVRDQREKINELEQRITALEGEN